MIRLKKRQLSASVAIALVLLPLAMPVAHADYRLPKYESSAKKARTISTREGTAEVGSLHPIDQSDAELSKGVTEKKTVFKNSKNNRTVMHAVSVDAASLKSGDAGFYVGTPNNKNYDGGFELQKVSEQAEAAIKDGKHVIAGGNADFFAPSNEPLGVVVRDKVELHAFNNNDESFFGIQDDGTPVIGDKSKYSSVKDHLVQAIGGLGILVQNGEVTNNPVTVGNEFSARAAVGIKKDGSIFFVTIDGQQAPYSNGMSTKELAQTMKDQGAEQALNFDGGGSTTYLSRTPGEDNLSVKNRPSDGSGARAVANSWFIVAKNGADHNFKRARVTPDNQVYMPNNQINFKANGVDSGGYSAPLPAKENLKWELAGDSKTMGNIDSETGVFTSTGSLGNVTAVLKHNNQVVGQSTVTIATPDAIDFLNTKVSFEAKAIKSLGLSVTAKGRDVVLGPNDIEWTFPKELGTIDEKNRLHTSNQSAHGIITAKVKGTNLTKDIDVQIGQLPKTLYDFEKDLSGWQVSSANRGEDNSIMLSDLDNGQVRFGNHALQLNYDFTDAQKGTTLGAYAGPGDSVNIPGAPTAIGMWVYATPAAQKYWLRMNILDTNGTMKPIDFTDSEVGINWTGWKYIEAPIPSTYQGPFKTMSKQMIRMMSLKSGTEDGGPMTKGSLYVDNVRAVYGTNEDDTKSPIIESLTTKAGQPLDGKTFKTNQIDLKVKLHENEDDPHKSGIDWTRNKIWIDGKELSGSGADHYHYDEDGDFQVYGYKYADGEHHVKIAVYDKFGNRTDKEADFTVTTGNQTSLGLKASQTTAKLGNTADFDITAERLENIESGSVKVKLAKGFPVKNVTFDTNDDKKTANTYDYDPKTGMLTLNITKASTKKTAGTLAHVSVDIPGETLKGTKLTYQLVGGNVKFKNVADEADMLGSVTSKTESFELEADYQLKASQLIVGGSGIVSVVDGKGKPVPNASITMTTKDGKVQDLGDAGDDGRLKSHVLTRKAQKFRLSANMAHQYSFPTKVQTVTAQLTAQPTNLLAGSTQEPTTQKTITWMSNPLLGEKAATMQIATDADYAQRGERAYNNYRGTQQVFDYVGDGSAVKISSVTAKNLKPGTAYTYRVGDGKNWSAPRHFKTLTRSRRLTFNIFGDTQVNTSGQLKDFGDALSQLEKSNPKPDFAIHVGDFNDDQSRFDEANITAQMFNNHPGYDSLDMIHVLGNHEYMGDDGTKSTTMLGVPGHNGPAVNRKGTYSVDYGNMHIASLGWTDNKAEMKQELDWLRQDMKATKKTWKIIATHQPAYNKNPADSQSTMFHDMLPPVCDELGIDVVFSGHDHSYGRTKALINHKENGKGTVYIAAGHTGDKTYDISPNEKDVWAYIQKQEEKTQKVFLTAHVDGTKMQILVNDASGKPVDHVTLSSHNPNPDESGNETNNSSSNTGGNQVTSPTKPVVTDKSALSTAVKNAERLKADEYTAESFRIFEMALEKAKKVMNSANATDSEVKTANLALIEAQSHLKRVNAATSSHPHPVSSHKPVKKLPNKVVAVKSLALYRKPNFSKNSKLNSFAKMPQMRQAQFQVLGVVKAKNGRLRFHVKDINKHSKTYKRTGYITAAKSFVQTADYTTFTKRVTVINAKGLNSYKSSKLTGKVKHHYRQGQVLKIKRLIHRGQSFSFMLTNGSYVTANRQQVKAGKVRFPKSVKTKHRISLYSEAELKHRKHSINVNSTLKITGWDYSQHGTLRYRVAGGYITANHNLVK